MPNPIKIASDFVDWQQRVFENHTVAASPSAATETTICSLTISQDAIITKGIFLEAFAAYTVGTNGVSGNLKIRQTNTSGSTIAATGACTQTAANLVSLACQGVDASATLPGQVYVVTLTIASGSATSTVSSVSLFATVV